MNQQTTLVQLLVITLCSADKWSPYFPNPSIKYPDEAYYYYPEANKKPYMFGYVIIDEKGNKQSRLEESDSYGNVKGSYGYWDSYGIYREVDYKAGKNGFHAKIKTNEPGTSNQNPADVETMTYPPPSYSLHKEIPYSRLQIY